MKKMILGLVTALLLSGFALFGGVSTASAAPTCGGPDLPTCGTVPPPKPPVDAPSQLPRKTPFRVHSQSRIPGSFIIKVVRQPGGKVVFKDVKGGKSVTAKVPGIKKRGNYKVVIIFNPYNRLYSKSRSGHTLRVG